jgi:glycosyltransferase involved in cell wall biosynthesis
MLGIPANAFVVLSMFDVHSTVARKNPEGGLRAFVHFAGSRADVNLVMKVHRRGGGAPDFIPPVNDPRVVYLEQALDPGQMSDLYAAADCYLSLHRSEGLGRTLVEALLHGKTLVANPYSGPSDFLNEGNALLVDYQPAGVAPGAYPNCDGSWWSEPSVAHAAACLEQAFRLWQMGQTAAGGAEVFRLADNARQYGAFVANQAAPAIARFSRVEGSALPCTRVLG